MSRWGRFIVLSFWLGLNAPMAGAQPPPDVLKRYRAAVRAVQTGDYERAKTDLNPLTQGSGPLAPYAHYYYALALFRQERFGQARLIIKQLMDRFPDWRKLGDAQYLLAAALLEMGQYEEGLAALQRIDDPKLRPDATRLEQSFVGRLTDMNRLKQLNQLFPDDRLIGLALIDLIQRTARDKNDLELSDRLTNRFGVPSTASTRPVSASKGPDPTRSAATARPARAKGYYNVALMLPFRVEDFDADRRLRQNQYVFDLYNGIKMAKAKLQEEGITVNLFAYDVDNDPNKTLELVNSPAFAQTDLVIGPLYAEPNRIVAAYADQRGIPLLNPIATSSELVENQPRSFLAQPSLMHQAQKAAEQAQRLNNGHRAAIYFGTTRKDSMLALAYQTELKRLNYQIVDFRKLSGSASAMADAMQPGGPAATTPASPTPGAAPTPGVTLSHIFLASSHEADGLRLLDALSRRRVSGPLIATATAFDFYRDPASTFTRRDLYLLYPDFVDPARQPVVAFEDQYLARRNTIPSVFARQGYDMMLFFGRQLAKNGLQDDNRKNLHSDPDDYLLSGFDYTQNNDNQIVPIVKYENGRFVKINE